MQQNQFHPSCPSCLDYQQSIESLYDEVSVLLENAIEDFREFEDGTLYRGRIDVLSLVKRRLEETLFVGEDEKPGFIDLSPAIEPDDDRLNRIMMKIGAVGASLQAVNSLALTLI